MFKFLVSCAIGLLVSVSVSAQNTDDPQIEIGIGKTHFFPHGDGVWYQKLYPYTLWLDSPSASIGVVKQYNGYRIRFGYQYLGKYETEALAVADDYVYFDYRDNKVPLDQQTFPLSHWYGKGEIHALYLTYLPEWEYGGKYLFLELGASVYVPSWVMTVPDWRPCETCDPYRIQVRHKRNAELTYIVGAGIRDGNSSFAINLRNPSANGDPWTSIAHNFALSMEYRYAF